MNEEEFKDKLSFIDSAVDSEDYSLLKSMLENIVPPEIANLIHALERDRQIVIFRILESGIQSEVIKLVDEGTKVELLKQLEDQEIVSFISSMASDDAADLMNLLPTERKKSVLRKVSAEDYKVLIELLKFDEESAGGLMARELITVRGDMTISQVIGLIRKEAEDIEKVQNVYVIDEKGKLLGMLPVINLIMEEPDKRVEEVMWRDIVTVSVQMDQEEVASVFAKYDLYSIPVVDGVGRLRGRITVDDIIDVIEEEANEDISKMAGTTEEELWEKSAVVVSRTRLPWLLVGLGGGIASAFLISRFRTSLETVIALAFFVPIVMAMGGNVGIQSSAIVVRELAIGEEGLVRMGKKLWQELKVSLINGVVLGAVFFSIVTLWQQNYRLGLFLGICLMGIILWATFMGTFVPLLLKRLNIDPALATGPFITTSNDILGILIYLGVASLLLSWID
jgi:magnesium transporter